MSLYNKQLSASLEDYLEAIFVLSQTGRIARSKFRITCHPLKEVQENQKKWTVFLKKLKKIVAKLGETNYLRPDLNYEFIQ